MFGKSKKEHQSAKEIMIAEANVIACIHTYIHAYIHMYRNHACKIVQYMAYILIGNLYKIHQTAELKSPPSKPCIQ